MMLYLIAQTNHKNSTRTFLCKIYMLYWILKLSSLKDIFFKIIKSSILILMEQDVFVRFIIEELSVLTIILWYNRFKLRNTWYQRFGSCINRSFTTQKTTTFIYHVTNKVCWHYIFKFDKWITVIKKIRF